MSYLILDPICDHNTGITTYSTLLHNLLLDYGLDAVLLSNKQNRPVREFYNYIQNEIDLSKHFVEIPETDCTYINKIERDNVRLHGNRKILNDKQGISIGNDKFEDDLKRILLSKIISSPSQQNAMEMREILNTDKIIVYPNPIPEAKRPYRIERDIDFLFLGRYFKIKGIDFLPQFERRLNKKISVYSSNISTVTSIIKGNRIKNNITKSEVYSRTKVVIIPSLYETFSMVKYEALSYGCNVVTWDTTPVNIKEKNLGVFVAKSFDVDQFVELATSAEKNFQYIDDQYDNYKKYSEDNNKLVISKIQEMMNE